MPNLNLTPPFRASDEPLLTLSSRIGWHLRFSEITFDDPPTLVLQATPELTVGHNKLAEQGIVWDVFALIDSVKRAGAHYVLTCDCGYAPDADIQEAVLVSHPDDETIVWELDIAGLRPVLLPELAVEDEGYIRLTFARDQYEQDIRTLVHDLQQSGGADIAIGNLTPDCYGLDHLRENYPHLDRIRVDELEPGTQGMALERLLEVDASAPLGKRSDLASGGAGRVWLLRQGKRS